MKNKPTLKKGIVAASVVAGVAGGLVAGLALGVPGFAGASSNGVQGASSALAKNAVVQLAADDSTATTLPGNLTVGGANGAAAGDADHAPRGPRAAVESDAVAKVLGLSVAEMQTQLQSGKSLADVAKAQNVDIQKVKDAIVAGITAHFADEVKSGEHTQAEVDQRLADLKSHLDDIVNGVKPAGMPGKGGGMGHGPRGGAPFASDVVAKALGLTATELQTQLQSGKSLADIAKAQNVDIQKVKDAIVAGITAHFADEVKSGEHTQAEVDQRLADLKSHLDDIVNGVKPAGMPGKGGGMGHGPRGGHGGRGEHGGPGGDHGQLPGNGSAPTLQGSVTVQPSGANA